MKNIKHITISFVLFAIFALYAHAESLTYLGIATVPLDPAIADHLKLDEGVGLTVRLIDPESAAADVLELNDILYKLDDQLLIDPRQLSVLIRNRKPEEEIKLTVLRHGDEILKEITLGKKDALDVYPPMPHAFTPPHKCLQMPPFMVDRDDDLIDEFQHRHGDEPEDFYDSFEEMSRMAERFRNKGAFTPGFNKNSAAEHHIRFNMTSRTKNGVTFNYTNVDGDKQLKVTEDGDILFEGPINTKEELDAVPDEAREFLESVGNNTEHDFFEAPKDELEDEANGASESSERVVIQSNAI